MATGTKKTATKKSGGSKGITVEMDLAKTTKNTYRFEANDEDAVVTTLYVKQSAFKGDPPESITLSVN